MVQVIGLDVHGLASVGFFSPRRQRKLKGQCNTTQIEDFFQGTKIADEGMCCIVGAEMPALSAPFTHLSNQEIRDLQSPIHAAGQSAIDIKTTRHAQGRHALYLEKLLQLRGAASFANHSK